jgi:hypothetical protein
METNRATRPEDYQQTGKEVTIAMSTPKDILYATVGAGDFLVEKARSVQIDRAHSEEVYQDFVKRGRQLSQRIGNAAPTKQALDQTKTARSQVKAAATSVGKAVRANTKATTSAARKAAGSS